MSTGRKVFHCAVDETALTTNISEIKKWTTNGSIDLIVPLYSRFLANVKRERSSFSEITANRTVHFQPLSGSTP